MSDYAELRRNLEKWLGTKVYETGGHWHGYATDDDDADFFVDRDAPDIIAKLLVLGFVPSVQPKYADRGEWQIFHRDQDKIVDVWIYNYPVEQVATVHRVMKKLFGAEFGQYCPRDRQRLYDKMFGFLFSSGGL